MKTLKIIGLISSLIIFSLLFTRMTTSETQNYVCVVYFTGIGCPHCAKTDPIVLSVLPEENKKFVVIEYEIYQQRENAVLLPKYDEKYNTGLGVPLVIFNKNDHIIGDMPILNQIRNKIDFYLSHGGNECPLLDGSVPFENLEIDKLPGKPKIWIGNKILIKEDVVSNVTNKDLISVLTSEDVEETLKEKNISFEKIQAFPAPLSGSEVKFTDAVKLGNLIIEWGNVKNKITGNSTSSINFYLGIGIAVLIICIIVPVLFYIVKIIR